MFEQATKIKLRFESPRGNLSVEDVWDLPLISGNGVSLDALAKSLNKAVKEAGEESFVVKKSKVSVELNLKFDIVKHIIAVRLKEIDAAKETMLAKAKKDKILTIIAGKEDEELAGLSVDELKKMAKKL